MDYLCTCCEPARPMWRRFPDEEWMHTDDETYAEVFHVHEHSASRDCDGPHETFTTSRIRSLRWTAEELSWKSPPEPDADDLWRKLCRLSVPFHAPGTISITDNDDGTLTMFWSRPTEEGFHGETLVGCKDPDCAHDNDSQYDQFAEQAGY
jgi:hypothetical protein